MKLSDARDVDNGGVRATFITSIKMQICAPCIIVSIKPLVHNKKDNIHFSSTMMFTSSLQIYKYNDIYIYDIYFIHNCPLLISLYNCSC